MTRERLQKVMAAAGVASRRECENIIAQRRVAIDGEITTKPGSLVDAATQTITVDGRKLRLERKVYYLLNKPRGVICSHRSVADKPRAVDYVPAEASHLRLYTIGRLDVDSEGAIILTNDGDLTHTTTHPRFEVEKTYRVDVEGSVDPDTLAKMRKGVWLSEGRTGPVYVRVVKRASNHTILQISLREGKKREVRRLCARFGHEVKRLVRITIGPVKLGRLQIGHTRPLTPAEVRSLRGSASSVVRLGGTTRRAPPKRRGGSGRGSRR